MAKKAKSSPKSSPAVASQPGEPTKKKSARQAKAKTSAARQKSSAGSTKKKGPPAPPPTPPDEDHEELFPIVGIGASAGGLAALKRLFLRIPADSGAAYVVVVHLSPEHESHLAELLQPSARIPVMQVNGTIQIERNQVYVIPPNANLETIDTHLRLSELEFHRRQRAPIDHFFRMLAKTHDGQAVGVILTGTGADGTLGLREIKESGGTCLVQDPAEAEYDGMPQSAIAAGIVDLVLPVEQIAEAVLKIIHTRPRLPAVQDGEMVEAVAQRVLQKVYAQLRARTGRDFSRYKRSTIIRRVERRMQLRQIEELPEYLEILRSEPNEVRTLGDDLLITVTSFFRDPEVFEMLEKDVIPQLFAGKSAEDEIRVWSVGCASGEEAYSLAILLLEEAGRHELPPRIQIFASDLHEHSLVRARDAFYPGDIETDVSPERLNRYFLKEKGGYRIRKELREMVVFAPHNLLGDPPFSRLNLISCRNLLIYIQREVQRDIVELFHYALKPEGVLVLGQSETVDAGDLFRIENKKCCIYRKRNVPAPEPRLPVFPSTHSRLHGLPEQQVEGGRPIAYGALHQRMVEQYAPPSALVSSDDKVVHLSEHAGRYLLNPGGEPTVNIYKLVRKELQIELRTALHTARTNEVPVETKAVSVRFNGDSSYVSVRVRPALEPSQKGYVLLIFEERTTPEPLPASGSAAEKRQQASREEATDMNRVAELEAELDQTRQRLQAIIEEYETSQEEMKASNEEMQSTNEELRSTMEELETSKEELQSMNEELQTVNQENRHKVEELSQLTGDLQNLLAATDIATLFLDRELRILRFTPKVGDLFNVRMTDRGRPLSDLTHRLGYGSLIEDGHQVLRKLVPVEREVEDESGRWYLTRVMPYRSADDRIEGVVITFVDISGRKRAEVALRERAAWLRGQREALELALNEAPLEKSLGVLLRTAIDTLGPGAGAAFYLANESGTELRHIVGLPRDYGAGVETVRIGDDALAFGLSVHTGHAVITSDVTKDPQWKPWLWLAERFDYRGCWSFPINTTAGRNVGTLVVYCQQPREPTERDLELASLLSNTAAVIIFQFLELEEYKRGERALRESEERFRMIADNMDQLAWTCDELGNCTWYNRRWLDYTGLTFEEMKNWGWQQCHHPGHLECVMAGIKRSQDLGEVWDDTFPLRGKYGQFRWFLSRAVPIRNAEGQIIRWFGTNTDVTDQLNAEEALRESDRRKSEFLAVLAHELRNPLAPIRTGLELMKTAKEDPPLMEQLRAMLDRQTEQLVRLIDDLLDVSRITHGRMELRLRRTRLNEVIQNAIEAASWAIDQAELELAVALPVQPIDIYVDPHRITQVVSNLLNNAIKYTLPGGKIRLTAEQQGKEIVIVVQDTGIGMKPDLLGRVFEMFVQANPHGGSGLGIGLSLVKLLVELHGGNVDLHSDGESQGTTVTVRLPVVVTDDVPESVEPDDAEPADLTGLRVLVVDDHKVAADILGLTLQRWGCQVQMAYSGDSALKQAAVFHPQAVVMDIGMPQLNGLETAHRMRQEAWGKDINLIALTGWGQESDKRSTAEAGFDQHLVKPPEVRQLRRMLAQGRS